MSKETLVLILIYLSISFKVVNSSNSNITFNYPLSVLLSNENIFVIHEDGVSVYDSTLSNLISQEITFTDSEKSNYIYYFSSVTVAQFENGYIVCIINHFIYFFDYLGTFIFKDESKIDVYTLGLFYTLVPIKIYNGLYFYVI